MVLGKMKEFRYKEGDYTIFFGMIGFCVGFFAFRGIIFIINRLFNLSLNYSLNEPLLLILGIIVGILGGTYLVLSEIKSQRSNFE